MTLQQVLESRRKTRNVTKDIPGLGTVIVRRLTAGEDLALSESAKKSDHPYSFHRVAACVADSAGVKLYASAADVAADDDGVVNAFLAAVAEVNKVNVEEAAKN